MAASLLGPFAVIAARGVQGLRPPFWFYTISFLCSPKIIDSPPPWHFHVWVSFLVPFGQRIQRERLLFEKDIPLIRIPLPGSCDLCLYDSRPDRPDEGTPRDMFLLIFSPLASHSRGLG